MKWLSNLDPDAKVIIILSIGFFLTITVMLIADAVVKIMGAE